MITQSIKKIVIALTVVGTLNIHATILAAVPATTTATVPSSTPSTGGVFPTKPSTITSVLSSFGGSVNRALLLPTASVLTRVMQGFAGGFVAGLIPVVNVTAAPIALMMPIYGPGGSVDVAAHVGLTAGYITAMACWMAVLIKAGIIKEVAQTQTITTKKLAFNWPTSR